MKTAPSILRFSDIDLLDKENIGSEDKKISLLSQSGIPIPEGFIISSTTYMHFLQTNKLDIKIKQLLSTVHFDYPETLLQIANHIKKIILESPFSEIVQKDLYENYHKLDAPMVSLKAYSHTKDYPLHNSQQAVTFDEFLMKIKDIWAAHFSGALLYNRNEEKLPHLQTGTTIIVQKILHSTKRGTITTISPTDHAKDKMFLTHDASYGKDTYTLSKKNLSILERHIKNHKISTLSLSIDEILEIAKLAKKIEKLFYFPQEITWMYEDTKLYMLSTKQFTDLPKPLPSKITKHAIARGYSLNKAISTGYVKKIHSEKDLYTIKTNEIVVASQILPSYLPYIKKVRGIIAEKGEKHSHITSVLRQHGIPTLYDVKYAQRALKNGTVITIHGGKGEIYTGGIT